MRKERDLGPVAKRKIAGEGGGGQKRALIFVMKAELEETELRGRDMFNTHERRRNRGVLAERVGNV